MPAIFLAAFGFFLFATAGHAQSIMPADDTSIRPFHVNIPAETLVDLRRRIAATRWPDKETVTDASQGVQLATMQKSRNIGRRITIAIRN